MTVHTCRAKNLHFSLCLCSIPTPNPYPFFPCLKNYNTIIGVRQEKFTGTRRKYANHAIRMHFYWKSIMRKGYPPSILCKMIFKNPTPLFHPNYIHTFINCVEKDMLLIYGKAPKFLGLSRHPFNLMKITSIIKWDPI